MYRVYCDDGREFGKDYPSRWHAVQAARAFAEQFPRRRYIIRKHSKGGSTTFVVYLASSGANGGGFWTKSGGNTREADLLAIANELCKGSECVLMIPPTKEEIDNG